MNLICVAHVVMNLVKDLINLMKGKGKGAYTVRAQELDRETGEEHVAMLRTTPWRARLAAQKAVDALIQSGALPMWSGADASTRGVFKHTSHLKIHDCYLFLGVRGAYFISLLGLNSEYTELFTEYLFALENLTLKRYRRTDLPKMKVRLARVVARMEMKLPAFTNTIVKHQAVCCVLGNNGVVARAGPSSATSMLAFERFNTVIKKLAHSTKNLEVSLSKR
jgi:hypothetical protein